MAEMGADAMHRQDEGVYVQLTEDHLDVSSVMARVKSPDAGAVVLFAGKPLLIPTVATTQKNFPTLNIPFLASRFSLNASISTASPGPCHPSRCANASHTSFYP